MVNYFTDKIDDPTLQRIYDNYRTGFYIRTIQDAIVNNFTIAGLFPAKGVPATRATMIEERPINDLIKQITDKKAKLAKDASARHIRGVTLTKNNIQLNHEEFIYEILMEDLEDPMVNLTEEIQKLGYAYSYMINSRIMDTVRKAAVTVDPSIMEGGWSTATDSEVILRDIRRMQDTFKDEPGIKADTIFANYNADFRLKTRFAGNTLAWEIPSTGFTYRDALNVMDMREVYGGMDIEENEFFVTDSRNPAITVLFKEFSNPAVGSYPSNPYYANVSQPIKMLMYNDADANTNPSVFVKIASCFAAYAKGKGRYIGRLDKDLI